MKTVVLAVVVAYFWLVNAWFAWVHFLGLGPNTSENAYGHFAAFHIGGAFISSFIYLIVHSKGFRDQFK